MTEQPTRKRERRRGISTLDSADLAREKLVIEAEDVGGYTSPRPGLLTYRFGAEGVGRAYGAPTTDALTLAETVAWAERWFVAENVVLTCLGAVPAELDVRLPDAHAEAAVPAFVREPLVTPVAPGGASNPRLIASRKLGVGLSMRVPAVEADALGEALRAELLDRLRHRSGLIYWIEVFSTRVDERSVQLDVVLDPLVRNVVSVTLQVVAALSDIAEGGFSDDSIAAARLTSLMDLDWEASAAAAHLERLALDRLRGWSTPSRANVRQRVEAMTSRHLAAVLAAARGSLIIAFDDDVAFTPAERTELGLPIDPFALWNAAGVSKRRPPRSKRGRSGRRRRWRDRSGARVLWLAGGRVLRRHRGSTTSFRLRDVVLLGVRPCGCLVIVDRWGRTDDIATEEWKHGTSLRKTLIAALGTVLASDVVRPFPDE